MTTLKRVAFGVEPSNRTYRLRLARYLYMARTLDGILPQRECRVLDAGSGRGRLGLYWRAVATAPQRASIIGMDLDGDRLKLSRTRGYGVVLRQNLLQPWPFAAATFDAVVCEQVLEHFSDADGHFVLAEVRRVLKPGGVALVGTPVFTRVGQVLLPIFQPVDRLRRRLWGSPATHVQHLTLAQLRGRLRQHGLTTERTRGFRMFSFPGAWLEDYAWYFRLHEWLGEKFPSFCVEASLVTRAES